MYSNKCLQLAVTYNRQLTYLSLLAVDGLEVGAPLLFVYCVYLSGKSLWCSIWLFADGYCRN